MRKPKLTKKINCWLIISSTDGYYFITCITLSPRHSYGMFYICDEWSFPLYNILPTKKQLQLYWKIVCMLLQVTQPVWSIFVFCLHSQYLSRKYVFPQSVYLYVLYNNYINLQRYIVCILILSFALPEIDCLIWTLITLSIKNI